VTQLFIFLLLGVVLLVFFLLTLRKSVSTQKEPSANLAMLVQMVSLPGLSFTSPELLFDEGDYAFLRSTPDLAEVAQRFRRDRRRLVLHWLTLMERDVFSLWRLRRLVARHGVSSGVGEEWRVMAASVGVLVLLFFLRVLVWIAGPFAPFGMLRSSRARLEMVSSSCAGLLARVPEAKLDELRRVCELEFARGAAL
jgi:hypothetical protein